jgi:integrase
MHTTILVDSGASIKTAQRQLRHANARTTLEVYAQVVDPSHRKAVEEVAKYLN